MGSGFKDWDVFFCIGAWDLGLGIDSTIINNTYYLTQQLLLNLWV